MCRLALGVPSWSPHSSPIPGLSFPLCKIGTWNYLCPMRLVSRLQKPSFIKATMETVSLKIMPPSAPSLPPLRLWMRSDPIAGHPSLLSRTRTRTLWLHGPTSQRTGSTGPEQPGRSKFLRDISSGENSAFGESISPLTSEKLEAVERPGWGSRT